MTMEKSSYYLSKHAFCCLADNHYVFLDLRSDEYLCLGRMHTDAVKSLLNGCQVINEHPVGIQFQGDGGPDRSAVVEALLQKGLLVKDVAKGKLPAPPSVNAPAVSLMEGVDMSRPGINPAHVWNFFTASATASKNLRWGSIEHTVRTVEDRNSGHIMAVDISLITGLFAIFQTLRLYYPRPYLCMFDSLALLHFLARYGIFPQWVYGVKLEPFAAHCWVQAGDLLINDVIDNVRDYTPIMSV